MKTLTNKEKFVIGIIFIIIVIIIFSEILQKREIDDLLKEDTEYISSEEDEIEQKEEEKDENKVEDLTENEIIVHITGAVTNPGIVSLDYGSRLIDAINALGGITEDANLESVNLARKLEDEEKVHIYKIGEEIKNYEVEKNLHNTTNKDKDSDIININTCSKDDLVKLPGIGEKTAEKILSYREDNVFEVIEDIMNVSGIGEKKFEGIKEFIKTE